MHSRTAVWFLFAFYAISGFFSPGCGGRQAKAPCPAKSSLHADLESDKGDRDPSWITAQRTTITPATAPAASNQRFALRTTVTESIQTGGAILAYIGGCDHCNDFCPFTADPDAPCGSVQAKTSNPDVTLSVTVSYNTPNIAVRMAEVSVQVTQGALMPGDRVTLLFGANAEKAYTQEIAHQAEITVLVQHGPEEEAEEIPDSPILTVTPLEPARLLSAVKIQTGMLRLSLVDRYTNLAEGFDGRADVHLIEESGSESPLGSVWIRHGRGSLPLPSLPPGYYVLRTEIPGLSLESLVPFAPGKKTVFFGDLHVHTKISDSYNAIDPLDAFRYGRNVTYLDFISSGDHAECTAHEGLFTQYLARDDVGNPWDEIKRIDSLYDDGEMIALLGYEVTFSNSDYPRNGHTNVYFRENEGNLYTSVYHVPEVEPANDLPGLWIKLFRDGHPAMTVPHTTLYWHEMGTDWHYYLPYYVRVVEIYSQHGCSESPDCPHTLHSPALDPDAKGSVQRALGPLGYRLGFIANSDSHTGHPSGAGMAAPYFPVSGGLTAAITETHSRAAIWDALYNRSVYATTGVRTYVAFSINGQPMGSEIGVAESVEIEGRVIGADEIREVEIVKYDASGGWRNLAEYSPGSLFWHETVTDPDIGENALYYLRITQEDGHMAWSSPIWVDSDPAKADASRATTFTPPLSEQLRSLGYLGETDL